MEVRQVFAFGLGVSLVASGLSLACSGSKDASPAKGATEGTAAVVSGTVAGVELPAQWPNHGSTDCVDHKNSEPSIYVFNYDADTFILRENKCLNFEANFIYLLFGKDKVLLQDTGSIPADFVENNDPETARALFTQAFPLRATVEGLIRAWLGAHPNSDGSPRGRDSIELMVTHSHSHGDHVSGDYQFMDSGGNALPRTSIAGHAPEAVANYFGIQEWPGGQASLDLGGGRILDVLPIPGHEPAHIAVYDRRDQLLLSGDSLYPGHVFVTDWPQYTASMTRLNAWVRQKGGSGAPLRPVIYILGNHIEKPPTPGQFYPYPSWVQDPERNLEFTLDTLGELVRSTAELGPDNPGREVFYDDFTLDAR